MDDPNSSSNGSSAVQLFLYWLIVGLPLGWGVWKTAQKLPALFH